jgi:hypothetical protein
MRGGTFVLICFQVLAFLKYSFSGATFFAGVARFAGILFVLTW